MRNYKPVTTYEFTLRIDQRLSDEAQMESIYARCSDSSLLVEGDVTLLRFHREAASLQDAIQSAIADVNAAGYHVGHVERSTVPGAFSACHKCEVMPYFKPEDRKLIEALSYDPTVKPSFELIKSCLIWIANTLNGNDSKWTTNIEVYDGCAKRWSSCAA